MQHQGLEILNRLKRIYGYLKKFDSVAIRVRLLEPDLGELPDQDFDWCHSVYGNIEEPVPKDAPKPLGKLVATITYTDATPIMTCYLVDQSQEYFTFVIKPW
jgi:hypothetical protein